MKKLILTLTFLAILQHGFSQVIQNDSESPKSSTTETDKKSDSKEKQVKKEKKQKPSGDGDYYKEGFNGITEVGTYLSFFSFKHKYSSPTPYFSFNQVVGSRVSPHFGMGMGFGVEVTDKTKYAILNGSNNLNIPVTLDMRAYFLNGRYNPFLNIAPGYAFQASYNSSAAFKAGWHSAVVNISPGVEIKIKKEVGVSLNTGYRLTIAPPQKPLGTNGTSTVFLEHGWYLRCAVVF